MRNRKDLLLIIRLLIVLGICVYALHVFNVVEDDILIRAFATVLGSFVIALSMLIFQRRADRTKYLTEMLKMANDICSFTGVWRLNSKTKKWQPCEFRRALGQATWELSPYKEELNDEGVIEYQIEWPGVLYKIDENYIISSKAIQDYSNWFQLIISGYGSGLLEDKDIKLLWRQLVDVFKNNNNKKCDIRDWIEYYLDGEKSKLFKNINVLNIQDIVLSIYAAKEYSQTQHTNP